MEHQTNQAQNQRQQEELVVAFVHQGCFGQAVAVAQTFGVDHGDAAEPVAVDDVSAALLVVLATGKVPHEVAPVHVAHLVVHQVTHVLPKGGQQLGTQTVTLFLHHTHLFAELLQLFAANALVLVVANGVADLVMRVLEAVEQGLGLLHAHALAQIAPALVITPFLVLLYVVGLRRVHAGEGAGVALIKVGQCALLFA